MLKLETFATHFAPFTEIYGKSINDLLVRAYYRALKDRISDDAFEDVLCEAIARYKFFPTAEEIIACYEGDAGAIALTEWDAIDLYVSRGGKRVSEIAGLSEAGKRALRNIGGLEIFRSDNFLSIRHRIRRDFLEAREAIARQMEAEKIKSRFLALKPSEDTPNDKTLTGDAGTGETAKIPALPASNAVPVQTRYRFYTDEKGNPCAEPIKEPAP